VRLLHPRHDHGRGGAAARESLAVRVGDPRGPGREPLPLHGVRQDHRVGAGGVRAAGPGSRAMRPFRHKGAGQRMPLVDGIEKVTGRARYTADLFAPEALSGRIYRSPYAHAEIVRLDVAGALALPGVVAVVTGEDCDLPYGVLPIAQNETPLARGKVRYIGEPVAAVAAIDDATAAEALARIRLEVRELPACFEPAAARAP